MSFNISLHAENLITFNEKRRTGLTSAPLYSTTAVNIGNFSNFNLYCDNSVELNMGKLNPPVGSYQLATNCNFIKIKFDGKTVVGHITDWEYINDGNVNISYNVDPFTSAIESGFIDSMVGLCERTNLTYQNMFSNDQSEPFNNSDMQRAEKVFTELFNTEVLAFDGINSTNQGASSNDVKYVLTVSSAIAEYLGVTSMSSPAQAFVQELKEVTSLNFTGVDSTRHYGGNFRGVPLLFDTLQFLNIFVKTILGGCGFITKLPPTGVVGQDAVANKSYVINNNLTGGQFNVGFDNTDSKPLESIRFINETDIYNVYVIPTKFANNNSSYATKEIDITLPNLLDMLHGFNKEKSSKAKLCAYPYMYWELNTSNGDTQAIIPQTHFQTGIVEAQSPKLHLSLRFIGGDKPRLMGRLACRGTDVDPYRIYSVGEWFTIKSYPSLMLSVNNSYSAQVQMDVANSRKLSAIRSNALANARLKNPIRQGYIDTIQGRGSVRNSNGGMINQIGQGIGNLIGTVSNIGVGSLVNDKVTNELQTTRQSMNAENFIDSMQTYIQGNDYISSLTLPPFNIYRKGATDVEMFSFCRFIDKFGQTCNATVEPLTNTILENRQMAIEPVDGVTYFQFIELDVIGVMPLEWKVKIKELFESGVWLYDN